MQLVEHTGCTEGWPILDVLAFPCIVSNSPENVAWDCACGKPVARGLYARQVLDVLIRCNSCGRILRSPAREAGQPIAGIPVRLVGTFRLSGAIDLTEKPYMVVGNTALAGYAREVGRYVPDLYDPGLTPVLTTIDGASVTRLADRLQELLGSRYGRLRRADERGRQSHTPPRARHRLVELVQYLRDLASSLDDGDRSGPAEVDGDLLAEAIMLMSVSERWQHHPAWPGLRASLVSESEAPHTMMLLTIASYLADADNGIGIHIETGEQGVATADLWIEPDLSQRVDLEIKTPVVLRSPSMQLDRSRSTTVLQRVIKKSARQRSNTQSNLLVVGGYHLGNSYDPLIAAARELLAKQRRRWPGLAGVIISDWTYEATTTDAATTFRPIMRANVALHPGYGGDIRIMSQRRVQ